MKQAFIKTSFDLCTGCKLCQLACSYRQIAGYNPRMGLLNITHKHENLYHFPTVCNQCENPYCANICPVKAITREPSTGALVVQKDLCVGCGLCARYCPLDVIRLDTENKKSMKCDLCQGEPLCVNACPTGALELAYTVKGEADND